MTLSFGCLDDQTRHDDSRYSTLLKDNDVDTMVVCGVMIEGKVGQVASMIFNVQTIATLYDWALREYPMSDEELRTLTEQFLLAGVISDTLLMTLTSVLTYRIDHFG